MSATDGTTDYRKESRLLGEYLVSRGIMPHEASLLFVNGLAQMAVRAAETPEQAVELVDMFRGEIREHVEALLQLQREERRTVN